MAVLGGWFGNAKTECGLNRCKLRPTPGSWQRRFCEEKSKARMPFPAAATTGASPSCPAFFDEVDAYPAVTVIRRGKGVNTYTAFRPDVSAATLIPLSKALRGEITHPSVSVRRDVAKSDQSWAFDEDGCMDAIRRMETNFPELETVGVRVGIGVATGADAIFIGRDLEVEDSRKLPLATTRDIRSGRVEWGGEWVLNPFESDGRLVDLAAYPRFAAYLGKHRERQRLCPYIVSEFAYSACRSLGQ